MLPGALPDAAEAKDWNGPAKRPPMRRNALAFGFFAQVTRGEGAVTPLLVAVDACKHVSYEEPIL